MRRIAALVLASGVWTATMAAETGVAPGSTVDRIVEENAAARGGVEVYKTVEGLKIPMAIETGTGSGSGLERLVLDRVLLNPPIDDAQFGKPGTASLPGLPPAATRSRAAGS